MRGALLGIAALLPAIAQADVIEFDFSGVLNPSRTSSGPYDTFQATFLTNTSSGGFLQYTFPSITQQDGSCLASVSVGVHNAYDVDLTVDGKRVMTGGTGGLGFVARHPFKCGGFRDQDLSAFASAGGKNFSFGGGFDVFLSNSSQSAILSSKDPLALILSNALYASDPIAYMNCSMPGVPPAFGSQSCTMDGTSTAVSAHGVLEPDLVGLFAVAGLGLILYRRGGHPFKRWSLWSIGQECYATRP